MNSSPSIENTLGAALTPAPQKNCHSTLPVLASYALNQPLPSPVKTRPPAVAVGLVFTGEGDRKSTRLNSSHSQISYAVFCLKKKKKTSTSGIYVKDS